MLPSIDSLVIEVLEIYVYGTQGIMMSAYDFHLCIYFLFFLALHCKCFVDIEIFAENLFSVMEL